MNSQVTNSVALRVVAMLLFSVTTSHAHGHECVHDQISNLPGYGANAERIDVPYDFDTAATRRSFVAQQSSSYQSLRLQVFFDQGDCAAGTCGHCTAVGDVVPTYESAGATTTCQADDVLTTAKRAYIVDRLMPAARTFFQAALNVARVSGNLVVSGSGTCGQQPGTVIPAAHRSTGVADADFIAYVTAAPKADRTSATVAWAAACRSDSASRAVVAHVNFIPAKLTNAVNLTAVNQANDESTAVHEIAHALGFSAPFFGSRGYLDLDGVTMVQGGTTTTTSSALGKSVSYMNSPRVLREVRSYFGCATLVGAEIEDQGGSGTAGSHWEKRIFNDDSMAGISTGVLAYHSRVTLAFFEDTGHYTANYAAADARMTWGKGKGCAFAENKCDTLGIGVDNTEFCFDGNNRNTYCTFDRLARGYCGVGDYSPNSLPAAQQYFSGQPTIGGAVYHADYCPGVLPYGDTICIDPTASDQQDVYGNTYAATSRCFDSDLLQSGRSSGVTRRETRCFGFQCNGVRLNILVKGMIATCPADGTAGAADLSNVNGFSGSITCPVSSLLGCSVASPPAAGVTPSSPAATPGATSAPATTSAGGSGGGTPQSAATPAPVSGPTLVPTPAPASLPLLCSDRVPCARAALSRMPQCRSMARTIADCFGTDCDPQMEAFFAATGIVGNCSTTPARTAYSGACIEGRAGVADICYLATGAAGARGGGAGLVTLAALVAAVIVSQ